MKNIFKSLLVLLMISSIIGCTSAKTTIANQEEWDNAFDPKNYLNAKVTSVVASTDDDITIKTEYIGKDNAVKIINYFDEQDDLIYYYIDNPDSMSFRLIYGEGKGIFTTTDYEFETKEEHDENWIEMLKSTVCPNQGDMNDFSKGVYDAEKKCYCFDSTLLDMYPVKVEVYIENGLVVKILENIIVEEVEYMTIDTTFDVKNTETFELPDVKNKVSNEDEWKSLFDVEKYSNCSVDTYYDDIEVYSDITEDVITQSVYDNSLSTSIYRTIKRVDDTKESVVEEENEIQTEYEIEFDDVLTCFEDNYALLTYGENLKDVYNDITECEDHYEYELIEDGTKSLTKIYVSNGYIVKVINSYEYADGSTFEKETSMSYFGQTFIY